MTLSRLRIALRQSPIVAASSYGLPVPSIWHTPSLLTIFKLLIITHYTRNQTLRIATLLVIFPFSNPKGPTNIHSQLMCTFLDLLDSSKYMTSSMLSYMTTLTIVRARPGVTLYVTRPSSHFSASSTNFPTILLQWTWPSWPHSENILVLTWTCTCITSQPINYRYKFSSSQKTT